MNKHLVSTLILTVSANLLANQDQQKINDHLNDQRIQTETSVTSPQTQSFQKLKLQPQQQSQTRLALSKEELVQYPELVVRALMPAVMASNTEHVALLYPIYLQIPRQYQDPILSLWAEAIIAKQQSNYAQSIRLYREILAKHSEILPVRLQLAATLFENNELDAAQDQFEKLRADSTGWVQELSDKYLNAIQQRDNWSFSGGLTYLHDPNINNAPKAGTTYGNWTPPKRESAQGIGFNADIGKKWSWGKGIFNELRLGTNGKYYWNNRKYNEMSLRGSLGMGFQNAAYSLTVLPFMEQVLYAGGSKESETLKRFSKSGGATVEFSYWFSPKWRLNNTYEYGEQRYLSRKHLNGNYHFLSSTLLYVRSAKQHWFTSLNYNRTSTVDLDDSFFRRGISLGWGQEWGKGLSTRLSLSFAQKRYKGRMPIFNITQRNKEYGLQFSIWHRAVHYLGITPRLTYHFNKTKSNHVFYTYDKHRLFLEFSKQF